MKVEEIEADKKWVMLTLENGERIKGKWHIKGGYLYIQCISPAETELFEKLDKDTIREVKIKIINNMEIKKGGEL